MAFNLYFAGSEIRGVQEYLVEKKCCRLFSQANERRSILKYWDIPKDSKPKLMVDSGAFTEAHTGRKIDMDKYIDFINANDEIADIWVELDSIPYPVLNKYTAKQSAEKSGNNYLYMMDLLFARYRNSEDGNQHNCGVCGDRPRPGRCHSGKDRGRRIEHGME